MKYKTDEDPLPVTLASEPAAPAYGSEPEYAWEGDRVAMAALSPEDAQRIEREWADVAWQRLQRHLANPESEPLIDHETVMRESEEWLKNL